MNYLQTQKMFTYYLGVNKEGKETVFYYPNTLGFTYATEMLTDSKGNQSKAKDFWLEHLKSKQHGKDA